MIVKPKESFNHLKASLKRKKVKKDNWKKKFTVGHKNLKKLSIVKIVLNRILKDLNWQIKKSFWLMNHHD